MIKTIEMLRKQMEQITQKHNVINDIECKKISEIYLPDNLDELARYIELCWSHTYGSAERFDYNEDFISWCFQNHGLESEASVVLLKDNDVKAIILFTDRNILYQRNKLKTGICTSISVNPDFTSNGLGRYLLMKVEEAALKKLDGLFVWYHSSLKNEYSSHKVHTVENKDFFDHWGDYAMNIRIFDYEKAVSVFDLKFYEKLAAKIFSGIAAKVDLQGFEIIDESNYKEVCEYLNDKTSERGEGRLFAPVEFKQYALFKGEKTDFSSLGIIYRKNGRIVGVAIGYHLDIIGKQRANVFTIDYFHIEKNMNIDLFIKGIEKIASDTFAPVGILSVDSRFGVKQRYLPTGSMVTCCGVPYNKKFIRKDSFKRKNAILDVK